MKHRYLRQSLAALVLLVLLCVVVVSIGNGQTRRTRRQSAAGVSPTVKESVRQMSDYLKSLKEFTVHGEVAHNVILNNGEHLELRHSYDAAVQRPDHIKVSFNSPNHNRTIYYNGSTLAIYTPQENTYATANVTGNISTMFSAIEKKFGIAVPMEDFLSPDPYTDLMRDVKNGMLVGPSVVNGDYTKQFAFRQVDVDWQLWIEDSKTPLPRRLVITDRTQRGDPQYMLTLSNWNVNPTFAADTFTFTPPEGARKIKILEVPRAPRRVRSSR